MNYVQIAGPPVPKTLTAAESARRIVEEFGLPLPG